MSRAAKSTQNKKPCTLTLDFPSEEKRRQFIMQLLDGLGEWTFVPNEYKRSKKR
jgi:hypothetical protein